MVRWNTNEGNSLDGTVCVDGSFYARVNLSDFDVCRLRSCVQPFGYVRQNYLRSYERLSSVRK